MAFFVTQAKAASKGLKEAVRSCALLRRVSRAGQDLLLQQLKLALAQQEAAQEQEVKAVARLEKAEESGTKEAVEKAKKEVEKAERKVERAKKEVKEAKACGRTKESEAGGVGRFRRPAAFWDSDRCVRF